MERLGCLQFLEIMNRASLNIHVPVTIWIYVFISLGLKPSCGLLNHMVSVCLTLENGLADSYDMVIPFYISTKDVWKFRLLLSPYQHLVFSRPNGCVVVSHCGFNLLFSDW